MLRRRTMTLEYLVTVLLVFSASPVAAQTVARQQVLGRVVDAATMQPLNAAFVELQPASTPIAGVHHAVLANADGRYVFRNVRPGLYKLRAQSLGYQTTEVELVITDVSTAENVSLGLQVDPITLNRINAHATAHISTFADAAVTAPGSAAMLERVRQQRFLEGDAKLISHVQTRQLPAIGEPDLMRTFERLPGVSTRDEYTTELWIRGASWNRAAITLDRMPLFSPLHAGGAVTAISSDIVGNAALQPGAQWAGPTAGTAGSIQIDTRPGNAERPEIAVELTTLRGAVTFEAPLPGAGSWIVAARRSHFDLLPRGLSVLSRSSEQLPYMFADVASRLDYRLGDVSIEVSGLWERDRLNGPIHDIVEGRNAVRGSSVARVSLATPLLRGQLRMTVGQSTFAVTSDSVNASWDPAADGAVLLPGIDNAIGATVGELLWQRASEAKPMLGLRIDRLRSRIWTDGVWPYRESPQPFQLDGATSYATVWAQRRWQLHPRVTVEPGMTVHAGDALPSTGPFRYAPRASVRVSASGRTTASFAGSRSYQYARALTPAGAGFHRIAFADLFWLASDTVAPVASNIASATIEHWLSDRVILSIATYTRRAAGVGTPSTRFGSLENLPILTQTRERARGVEAYVQKLSGRFTGLLGYTYSRSELLASDSAANWFSSPFDRTHGFDALLNVSLPHRVGAALAFTAASGAPYTRFFPELSDCKTPDDCTTITPRQRRPTNPGRGHQPSALRGDWYRSADVSLRWNGRIAAADAELFLQLHNVFGRANPAAYGSSGVLIPECKTSECESGTPDFVDEALPGMARTAAAGIRVRF